MEDAKAHWIRQAQINKECSGKDWAVVMDSYGACCPWPVSRLSKDANVVYRTDADEQIGWGAAMEPLRSKFEGGAV